MQNNRRRPASLFAVEIADSQRRQALSAFYPQVSLTSAFTAMDEAPNFVFPASTMVIPGMAIPLPDPLPPIALPPQSFAVPQQEIKLADRRNLLTSLSLTYPLYTGGLREATVRRATAGLAAAKEEARRTDLEVIRDVKRAYYAVVLNRQLLDLGRDTLARMEVTLDLTKNLYEAGSESVAKTDYLRNQMVVEWVRSLVAVLEGNEHFAQAALGTAMGLEWSARVEPAEQEIPFSPAQMQLEDVIATAYQFNPDWARLSAGLDAAEAVVRQAKSEKLPKIALVGSLTRINNDYDAGFVTPDNKSVAMVGVGMELPVFTGFRTAQQVREARARLAKLQAEKVLLQEGIALQVQQLFLQMIAGQHQVKALAAALAAATENRDLNERAYREDLAEVKDVIEAQLIESLVTAQYQKVLYDLVDTQVKLDFVVGRELQARITPGQ